MRVSEKASTRQPTLLARYKPDASGPLGVCHALLAASAEGHIGDEKYAKAASSG
jgi:hypothetical protein